LKIFAKKPGVYQIPLYESAWISGESELKINYDGWLIANIRNSDDSTIAPEDLASDLTLSGLDFCKFINEISDTANDAKNDTIGIGNYPYYGQKIRLDSYYFDVVRLGNSRVESLTPQGACIYGDTLFQFFTGGQFSVYDLINNTVTGPFSPSESVPSIHCNSACFGDKQSSDDAFPLVYVNSYLDNVGKGKCYVQKITESSGEYTTTLIQTISIDFTDQKIWEGEIINPSTFANSNFIVDTIGKRLIAYVTQGFGRTRFFLFELPDASDSEVTLSQNDLLDYFDVAYIANVQDSCIHNGMLYMTSGINYGNYDQILRIYAINLSGRSIVSEIHLDEISLLNTEPEGIDFYKGSLIETDVIGRVNKLTF
jgi:hypothetical protein